MINQQDEIIENEASNTEDEYRTIRTITWSKKDPYGEMIRYRARIDRHENVELEEFVNKEWSGICMHFFNVEKIMHALEALVLVTAGTTAASEDADQNNDKMLQVGL